MPLHTACSSSNLEVVKVLLEKGADVAARDKVCICMYVRMLPDTVTLSSTHQHEFPAQLNCFRDILGVCRAPLTDCTLYQLWCRIRVLALTY